MNNAEFTNNIYNADVLKIMDSMISNNFKVDLIVTDPPYLVTPKGNNGTTGGMLIKKINKSGKVFDNNDIHINDWAKRLYDVLNDNKHCYVMTNHKNLQEYINVLTDVGFHFTKSLIWDKGNKIMGHFYMSQFEYILFFRKGAGVKINNCGTSDILSIPNKKTKDENGQNIHNTEKPVELMRILIENSSKENDIVFEPFMGSGSTVIASILSKRQYIGVEIDENYFNIAKKRIETAIDSMKPNKNSLF